MGSRYYVLDGTRGRAAVNAKRAITHFTYLKGMKWSRNGYDCEKKSMGTKIQNRMSYLSASQPTLVYIPRIRRVKCGEEKPECHWCTKTGRQRDGYDLDCPEMSSTAQSEKASTAPSSSLSPITSPTTSIVTMPSSINGDEQEQRSLHFFIEKTAPELAGFFESKFWTNLVLQRCHSDHCIRHAIIALGAYHESFKFGDIKLLEGGSIDYPKQRFALIQNNKAIRHLTGHLSHGGYPETPEVILISCLLFICFEAMQGNYQAAFDHLNSGLKILSDWMERNDHKLETHPESSLAQGFIFSELVPPFSILDIQATTISPTNPIQWAMEMTTRSTRIDFRTQ